MAAPHIPPDSTIRDIVPTLHGATEYVRAVFGNMADFQKEHGGAYVRIGTTGRGRVPNYRLQFAYSEVTDFVVGEDEKYFSAFSGRTHRKLEWGSKELQSESWSTRVMNFAEVGTLLGELRNFTKNRGRPPEGRPS